MQGTGWKSFQWLKSITLLSCIILTWIFPAVAFAQTTGPIYIVQPGDTLYLIALRFGTSVEAIASANGITDPSVIVPGLELVIPGFEGVSGVLDFHELTFGENIATLSSRYGLPPDAIIKLNRILHPGRFYIGQALIITASIEEEMTPSQSILLAGEGECKLAFAARNGVHPWDVSSLTDRLDRTWLISNERLVLSGDSKLLHSLPAFIEDVEVDPVRVIQGQTFKIKINSNKNALITGQLGDWQLNFHDLDDDQIVALQGILALTEPGMYDLEIRIWDDQGGKIRFSYTQPMRIVDGNYRYDPILYVPEETLDSEKTDAENELIDSIVNHVTMERYWDEIFEFPTSYTDSFPSYFGSRRNYNNLGYNWYHTGLDLYGGTGTPINAPASGRVVYAGSLEVRGNVTFIDHGWGVFTGYLHQSSIDVSIGDWVEVGQLIGSVGGTGRVTGPHLHWEVWVGGVPVDPLEWTSELFP